MSLSNQDTSNIVYLVLYYEPHEGSDIVKIYKDSALAEAFAEKENARLIQTYGKLYTKYVVRRWEVE